MTTKTNSTLYLDTQVIDLAHEMGLNISKTCENALKQAINRLQGTNSEIDSTQQCVNTQNLMVDRAGFEPYSDCVKNSNRVQKVAPCVIDSVLVANIFLGELSPAT